MYYLLRRDSLLHSSQLQQQRQLFNQLYIFFKSNDWITEWIPSQWLVHLCTATLTDACAVNVEGKVEAICQSVPLLLQWPKEEMCSALTSCPSAPAQTANMEDGRPATLMAEFGLCWHGLNCDPTDHFSLCQRNSSHLTISVFHLIISSESVHTSTREDKLGSLRLDPIGTISNFGIIKKKKNKHSWYLQVAFYFEVGEGGWQALFSQFFCSKRSTTFLESIYIYT